jgi:hypothetical protein
MDSDNLILNLEILPGNCAGFQTCQIPPFGIGVASLFNSGLRDHRVNALTLRQGGTYPSDL